MGDTAIIRGLNNGFNQKGVRDHNERLILTLLQRHGQLTATDIAKRAQVSAQTVSVILRKLENDGLTAKGAPIKGRVGKPSIPIALNPDGALSVGVKIGRRSCDFCLTNLSGRVLFTRRIHYSGAAPRDIFAFLRDSLETVVNQIGDQRAAKLSGVGVAIPFEMWRWKEASGNALQQFDQWQDVDLRREIHAIAQLPVFVINDATSACWAEHIYGRGREFQDYAYFFVSSFIGGGIVVNQNVHEGSRGNAGALGSIRVARPKSGVCQLVDVASIHVLEKELVAAGFNPTELWHQPQNWDGFGGIVDTWLNASAEALAQACLSTCAVIDFEAVLIDGALPTNVRTALVEKIRAHVQTSDTRGIIVPRIEEGSIGSEARAIGAACGPIYAQYFLSPRSR